MLICCSKKGKCLLVQISPYRIVCLVSADTFRFPNTTLMKPHTKKNFSAAVSRNLNITHINSICKKKLFPPSQIVSVLKKSNEAAIIKKNYMRTSPPTKNSTIRAIWRGLPSSCDYGWEIPRRGSNINSAAHEDGRRRCILICKYSLAADQNILACCSAVGVSASGLSP